MKRLSFTIQLSNNVSYDANHICSSYRDGDCLPMISFICSGKVMLFPASEVTDITFGYAHWCSECDQSLRNLEGSANKEEH